MSEQSEPQKAPTSAEEYNVRYFRNSRIDGYGIDGVTSYMPCPFCAAPDFIVHKIIDTEQALQAGATCKECGRSAKAIIDHEPGMTQMEIVQTGGDDPPEWLVPTPRRIDRPDAT